MYSPDYKLGLQKTLQAERDKNDVLKKMLSAMKADVDTRIIEGEGQYEDFFLTLVMDISNTQFFIKNSLVTLLCPLTKNVLPSCRKQRVVLKSNLGQIQSL